MNCGHQIDIECVYDFKIERWTAKVALREYRQSKQYGGTVLWEKIMRKGCTPEHAENVSVALGRSALKLINFRLK